MKRKKWLILLAVLAVLLSAVLVYTRPMTIAQLTDDAIDLSQTTALRGEYVHYTGTSASSEDIAFSLSPDDNGFAQLLSLFESRTVRRSLWNFVPTGGSTHSLRDGDVRWSLRFALHDVSLPDGDTLSGDVLTIDNFFGTLSVRFGGQTWRCTTAEQEQLLADVFSLISQE